MKILINDLIQFASGVPDAIKSPALYDVYSEGIEFDAIFSASTTIDCIGIGYTDATEFIIDNGTTTRIIDITKTGPEQNGLYIFPELSGTDFNISHDGTFVGRVGVGRYRTLCANPTMELGFYTTTESRVTLTGAVIPGAGGYFARRIDLDIRYKITPEIYADIYAAYNTQIMKLYPFFLYLDDEQHKVPDSMLYFYARTDKPLSLLQSSSYAFLYSYKFSFTEAF